MRSSTLVICFAHTNWQIMYLTLGAANSLISQSHEFNDIFSRIVIISWTVANGTAKTCIKKKKLSRLAVHEAHNY